MTDTDKTTGAECGCGLWICPTCRPSPPMGRDIYSGVGKQRRPYVDGPRPGKRPRGGDAASAPSVDPVLVTRALRAFGDALSARVNVHTTTIGDVPAQAMRDAMTEALEAINNV